MPDKNQMRAIEKPLRLVMAHVLRSGRGLCILSLILSLLVLNVGALKLPDEYSDEQCELIAKDYQREFGGDLIFIQPLKDNGAYDLGAYNGHWINKAYVSPNNRFIIGSYTVEGIYYIDYQSQTYFQSIDEIKDWYMMMKDKESEVFNVNQERVPFALRYHY